MVFLFEEFLPGAFEFCAFGIGQAREAGFGNFVEEGVHLGVGFLHDRANTWTAGRNWRRHDAKFRLLTKPAADACRNGNSVVVVLIEAVANVTKARTRRDPNAQERDPTPAAQFHHGGANQAREGKPLEGNPSKYLDAWVE